MNFEGSVAIVTGATRGIGRAIAERLAKGGAKVAGTATSESGAASIHEWLAPLGGVGLVLDVRDDKSCTSVVDEVTKTLGPVTILVNNAGITRDTLLMRMKEQDWLDVIDTDLSSAYRMCKAVIRGMYKERYGRIISIGSVVGSMGNFGQTNYAAAKAGLIGMSKSLAGEVGPRNITVNVVAPGFIETDMTKDLDESIRKKLFDRTLIPRFGLPDEVAAAVAFLASKEAGYITGNTLHVNGGLLMD